MTLVKLDSGDYINTEAVDSINNGDDQYLVMRCGDVISITPADKARIVEAMKPHDTDLRGRLEVLAKQWEQANELVSDDQDEEQFIEYTTRDECVDQLQEVLDA